MNKQKKKKEMITENGRLFHSVSLKWGPFFTELTKIKGPFYTNNWKWGPFLQR